MGIIYDYFRTFLDWQIFIKLLWNVFFVYHKKFRSFSYGLLRKIFEMILVPVIHVLFLITFFPWLTIFSGVVCLSTSINGITGGVTSCKNCITKHVWPKIFNVPWEASPIWTHTKKRHRNVRNLNGKTRKCLPWNTRVLRRDQKLKDCTHRSISVNDGSGWIVTRTRKCFLPNPEPDFNPFI